MEIINTACKYSSKARIFNVAGPTAGNKLASNLKLQSVDIVITYQIYYIVF